MCVCVYMCVCVCVYTLCMFARACVNQSVNHFPLLSMLLANFSLQFFLFLLPPQLLHQKPLPNPFKSAPRIDHQSCCNALVITGSRVPNTPV